MTAEALTQKEQNGVNTWLDRPVFSFWPAFTVEKLIIVILLFLTVTSRFYNVGARVMSHDEVNHVVPAYDFYQGRGYRYDPVTHGPFQFHMIAFSYFMLGDSDFSARVPAAIFGIAVVVFAIFAYRRYFGRAGALIAGLFFMISPYILFYSRYTRNEIFIVFWGEVMLWIFLRYLECGEKKYLIFLAVITAFHYTDKATAYIFTAEALIFLAVLFIFQMLKRKWERADLKLFFLITSLMTMITGACGFVFALSQPAEAQDASLAESGEALITGVSSSQVTMIISLAVAVIAVIIAAIMLIRGVGLKHIRDSRSFDLLALQISLILPLLSALPMKIAGFNPLDYTQAGILHATLFVVPMALLSILIGLSWNRRVWLQCTIIFWSIFTIFYTTIFTQGDGFFAGIMGALGYWMAQQSVQRGSQPLYYYALVQVPLYEFLPAIGTIVALIIGIVKGLFISKANHPFESPELKIISEHDTENIPEIHAENTPDLIQIDTTKEENKLKETILPQKRRFFSDPPDNVGELRPVPTLLLLFFWSLISLIAFSLAGERMPWLTTHIAMPMILCSAWGVGYLLETTPWHEIVKKKGFLVFTLGLLLILALSSMFGSLLGINPPFHGKELDQLRATSTFLLALLASIGSAAGLLILLKDWSFRSFWRLLLLSGFLILGVITFRTSFRASYILYDTAQEFLVYAHASRDPKDILEQIEEISSRLTGGKDIVVAYDNDCLYPYWWYFRDYPNRRWYNDTPTKDLRNAPIILVGNDNFAKIEPVVSKNYYRFDYKRMWWPMEDYSNLTFQRIFDAIKDPNMRTALWNIWFNRDYTLYAQVTGRTNLTLADWSPVDTMRMYIRKDIAAQIWEYGLAPIPEEPEVDPYEAGTISLDADIVITSADGLAFSAPRGIAIAPDGSLYIADSRNHRIVHLNENGELLHKWGTYADILSGDAPEGTFNEPWGIAVSPDGNVFVADTWNHRIQKFTADGQFITMWNEFGDTQAPDSFWGPRGIAVDFMGRVYVTDTGKQRVVIFDSNGKYITHFGGLGLLPGQFDEPVGIAVDNIGHVYIADTWNNRIQIMAPDPDYMNYTNILSWEIDAWNSQTLDNKPFLAINSTGQIFISDPDTGRILQFDTQGNFVNIWGGFDNAIVIGISSGLAVDAQDHVWVSDASNNSLLRFTIPTTGSSAKDALLTNFSSGGN